MPTVTILEKLYFSSSPETFESLYSNLLSGLKIQIRFAGTTNRGWIKFSVSGEDETIALNILDREAGLAPIFLAKVEKSSVLRGKIVSSNKKSGLYVDIGVFSPRTTDAVISKKVLCAQLADGKDVSLMKLVELFCLYENVPLEVKIVQTVEDKKDSVNARLSESQLSLFNKWVNSSFDRLIILGSSFSDVERSVRMSRHYRDIIKVESLGVLEQVILCKLGTDAVGLIPKLGRYLKLAVLIPFSPRKILKTVGGQHFS